VVVRVPHEYHQPDELYRDLMARIAIGMHVNINSVLGVCHLDHKRALVVLPAEQESLKSWLLQQHRLTYRQVYTIALHVARGLAFLHAHEYVHRDLHAGNVLVKADGSGYAITDFGLTRVLPPNESHVKWRSGELRPRKSLPPEGIRDDADNPYHSRASDIWMYGLLLFEVLTMCRGRGLYNGAALSAEFVTRICTGELSVTQGLVSESLPLFALVQQCVAVNEEERPTAATIVQELERKLVDGDSTQDIDTICIRHPEGIAINHALLRDHNSGSG
jgi:serine/threonine protein kinase